MDTEPNVESTVEPKNRLRTRVGRLNFDEHVEQEEFPPMRKQICTLISTTIYNSKFYYTQAKQKVLEVWYNFSF